MPHATLGPRGHGTSFLLLRLMLGSTFILHGSQKVFGAFDGPGLQGFADGVAKMGLPEYLGYVAAFCELLGGGLVLLGLCTRLGALAILAVMVTAVWKVHWSNGYFAGNQGFEYPLNLALAALALLVGGSGSLALGNVCGRRPKVRVEGEAEPASPGSDPWQL